MARNYFMSPRDVMTVKKMPTDSSVAIQIGTLSNQLSTKPTWPVWLLTCLLTRYISGGNELKQKELVQLFSLTHINILKESNTLIYSGISNHPLKLQETWVLVKLLGNPTIQLTHTDHSSALPSLEKTQW